MSRSVRRSSTCSIGSPCFINSAAYSLLYSVPICGGFDLPSVVTVVTHTLPPVTIGDDHRAPGFLVTTPRSRSSTSVRPAAYGLQRGSSSARGTVANRRLGRELWATQRTARTPDRPCAKEHIG